MSGIIGSKLNHRGSGLVGSAGTDGQHLLSSGKGKTNVFETVAAATAYDDEPIKSDLTALALREATNEASAAFNLPNSFIETFTDDTNLGTQTDGDRVSGYWTTISSAVGAFPDDSNTVLLMHMDDTSLIDSATTGDAPHTVTLSGDVTRSATQSKFGSYSAYFDGTGDYLSVAYNAQHNLMQNTNDWTVECWIRPNSLNQGDTIIGNGGEGTSNADGWNIQITTAPKWYPTVAGAAAGSSWSPDWGIAATQIFLATTWYHLALVRDSGEFRSYINGTKLTDVTDKTSQTISTTHALEIGRNIYGDRYFAGYIDEIRISNSARYTANFTPNTVTTASATGTLIQSANTVASPNKTTVGGTMLYKDNAGTATIGTDLKIYFTANGGSNWTEAASYNAITPVYSSGIKMVRLGETTVTAGTDVRYKAVWANQSDGSKDTQLHGIGTTY